MAAERQAMNAGIQGLAADLFKLALVRLDAALERDGAARNGPPARLVLQVHDEVIVEVPRSDPGSWQQVVTSVMEGVGAEVGLKVPLKVSSAWGDSWAEAKDH
jgi:DNA polymerase-1